MNSQVLHTVWCNISGEAVGEIGDWSPLGLKGLKDVSQLGSFECKRSCFQAETQPWLCGKHLVYRAISCPHAEQSSRIERETRGGRPYLGSVTLLGLVEDAREADQSQLLTVVTHHRGVVTHAHSAYEHRRVIPQGNGAHPFPWQQVPDLQAPLGGGDSCKPIRTRAMAVTAAWTNQGWSKF